MEIKGGAALVYLLIFSWVIFFADVGGVFKAKREKWRDNDLLFVQTIAALQGMVCIFLSLIAIFS